MTNHIKKIKKNCFFFVDENKHEQKNVKESRKIKVLNKENRYVISF